MRSQSIIRRSHGRRCADCAILQFTNTSVSMPTSSGRRFSATFLFLRRCSNGFRRNELNSRRLARPLGRNEVRFRILPDRWARFSCWMARPDPHAAASWKCPWSCSVGACPRRCSGLAPTFRRRSRSEIGYASPEFTGPSLLNPGPVPRRRPQASGRNSNCTLQRWPCYHSRAINKERRTP
jgi:hypothetical protein